MRARLPRRWDRLFGNPLQRILRRAQTDGARRFLLLWNRGLGDIALGLYPVFVRIREAIADAEITVVTRRDLYEPFLLVEPSSIIIAPRLQRGVRQLPSAVFADAGVDPKRYDVVLAEPDPSRWLAHDAHTIAPRLVWQSQYDALADRFALSEDKRWIAAHVSSETAHHYGYVKDWPRERWQEAFCAWSKRPDIGVLLFGHAAVPSFHAPSLIDLRGQTGFLDVLSLIKNRCELLLAPDSGILSMLFYLDAQFPLTVVSLWSDPAQGILKKAFPSPNHALRHVPLLAADRCMANVATLTVLSAVDQALATTA